MRLSEVKKAMNMKCAMNKLCGGGGDTAKKTGCEMEAFLECQRAAFLVQLDNESDTVYCMNNLTCSREYFIHSLAKS